MTLENKPLDSCTQVHEIILPDLHLGARQVEQFNTVQDYVEESLSFNSRKALVSDLKHFSEYGGVIPSTPDLIANYIVYHAQTLSVATLKRRLASISKAHNISGVDNPVSSELVKMAMRGIARKHGKPQKQATPILKDDLVIMLSNMPCTAKGYRDKALLILGFCGALRRSEVSGVQLEDLEFNSQGIILTLPRSKTDQQGQGRRIAIPFGRGRICPVQIVKEWIEFAGIEDGALFLSIGKGGKISNNQLSDRSVSNIIKEYATKAGLDAKNFSGHSLRSGLATSAAQHGVSSWKIREQTGHKSDAMLARYIREGDMFTDNAVSAIF